jgi:glycine/D-amino acid oxidase-like deaminating enzyme
MELAHCVSPLEHFSGISSTTSGFYGSTPDHNPIMDYDEQIPNLMRLVGFSGHGAMFGPFTAAVATALAEAQQRLDFIQIPTGRADLNAFHSNRSFKKHEQMVI